MNLYLGTEDGVAVLEDQREEWRVRYLRMRGHKVTAVAAAPGDPAETVWAGTEKAVWRSHDGGMTWSEVDVGRAALHVRAIAIRPERPDHLLVGTEPAGLLISHDGGASWSEASDVARLRDTHEWSLPYSPAAGCVRGFAIVRDRLYAAVEVGGVLRSDDAGASWRLLEGGLHADVHDVAGHPSDPDLVYAATGGGRYRSQNGGQSWDLIGDGYTRAVWVDPDQPEALLAGPARYVGAMGRIERSLDGGATWKLASDGLRIPMSGMVERFLGTTTHVFALTSGGALHVAKRGVWLWHPLELGLASILAITCWGR